MHITATNNLFCIINSVDAENLILMKKNYSSPRILYNFDRISKKYIT